MKPKYKLIQKLSTKAPLPSTIFQRVKNSAGFTLIELLVVISVIALIASVVLIAINGSRAKSRDAVRRADISQVSKALELYYDNNSIYPVGTFYSSWDDGGSPSSNGKCWCQDAVANDGFEQALVGSGIVSKLPHDPQDAGSINYLNDGIGRGFLYVSDGQSYVLGTYLETTGVYPPSVDAVSSCAASGNYQVSSGSLDPYGNCPAGTWPPPPPPPTPTPTPPPPPPTPTPSATPTPSGYTHYRTITVDHTKAGSSNTSNFAALISGSYSYLATAANGGQIQHTVPESGGAAITVPADLVFTTDSGCSSNLSWEFEDYNSTNGNVKIWVKIPTLSSSSDTVIYMCYNNPAVNSWQGNVSGAWDSNYKMVQHLPNGTTLTVNDSSGNGNGSLPGGYYNPTATSGKIDGAAAFDPVSSQYISTSMTSGKTFTWETWLKLAAVDSNYESIVTISNSNYMLFDIQNGAGSFWTPDGLSGATLGISGLSAGTWYHVVFVRTGDSTVSGYKAYVNGNLVGSADTGTWSSTDIIFVALRSNAGQLFNGSLDEVRISSSVRSPDQILAEYNNQSSPTTFYAVSTEH